MEQGSMRFDFAGDLSCVIRKPTKQIVNIGILKARKDKLALSSTILERCWVSGDEAIKTDDGCLQEFLDYIDEVCEVKSCESVRDGNNTMLVFEDNTTLVLKAPTRVVLNEAFNKAAKSPLAMTEHFIIHCTIEGDTQKVISDIGYLLGASACMDDVMQKKRATLTRI